MKRGSWNALNAEYAVRTHEVATLGKKAFGTINRKALLVALLAVCAMLFALPITAHAANDGFTSQDLGTNLGALDEESYVVTVDYGSKHTEFVRQCFGNTAGFTVNGSKVSRVSQGNTIATAKEAFTQALSASNPSRVDNGEFIVAGDFGLKALSEYANEEEYRDETSDDSTSNVPSTGMQLNAFWAQPAGDFEVTVKPLVCGTTVTQEWSGSMYYSNPRIEAHIVGNAVFDNTYSSNWIQSDSAEILEGPVTAGKDYRATVQLNAKFGYFFTGNEIVTIPNGKLQTYSSTDPLVARIYGTIPAVHDWGEATYTWSSDNKTMTASHTCKNTNCGETETETVDATIEITKQPTCSAKGEALYTAAFKKDGFETQSKNVDVAIDPDAHEWKSPAYTWSADNSAATATHICKHNDAHVQTENATAAEEVTKQPTCSVKGKAIYTATFKNAAFAKQVKTADLAIDPDAHEWGSPAYTWSKDNGTVVAIRKCANNAMHMQVEVASSSSKVTKAATSQATGTRTYTAQFMASWAKTQERSVEIAKLPPEPTPVTLAKLTAKGKTQLKLSWNKVTGAGRYLVYFTPCNTKEKTHKLQKVKTLAANKTSFVRSGLEKNTSYRARVVAQAKKNGKWVTISKSKQAHAVTSNVRGKYTNAKALALNSTSLTLKAGKTTTLSGLVQKAKEGEGMTAAVHTELLRFTSNNKHIATVNADGKVTAKQPGTCTIYVQTSNGIWKSCEVTVM